MDFAIAPVADHTPSADGHPAWQVVLLATERGAEIVQPLAWFGHRGHAEAFLSDLLARVDGH